MMEGTGKQGVKEENGKSCPHGHFKKLAPMLASHDHQQDQ